MLNLVPDKDQAFREIHRVLKPGGRLAVSDMAWETEPAASLRKDMEAMVGCIGGALVLDDYVSRLKRAGFTRVEGGEARRSGPQDGRGVGHGAAAGYRAFAQRQHHGHQMRSNRMSFSLIAALALAAGPASGGDVGPLVRALWLVQRYGTAEAVDPANDQRVKGAIFKALGKEGELTLSELEGFMEPETFKKLAGPDGRMSGGNQARGRGRRAGEPLRLLPKVREHADSLTTSFDMIDEAHRLAGQKLVDWIAKNYRPGKPLEVVVVCTGNSRRSILGATMGNIAAAYYGMPEIRFHSGGTAPTAFNSRTVKTLKEIGVEVEPTGKEAARGEPKTANPVYRIRWGSPGETGGPSMEATEFSKHYDDPANPQSGFAALMVCGEADAGVPVRQGSGPAGVDAVSRSQDLRRRRLGIGEIRRAAGRHRAADAVGNDAGPAAYRVGGHADGKEPMTEWMGFAETPFLPGPLPDGCGFSGHARGHRAGLFLPVRRSRCHAVVGWRQLNCRSRVLRHPDDRVAGTRRTRRSKVPRLPIRLSDPHY